MESIYERFLSYQYIQETKKRRDKVVIR